MEFLDLNNFEKLSIIGQGSFGKVFKVIKKDSKEIYAAKISLQQLNVDQQALITNLKREVNIISQLDHPSILKFIGYSPIDFSQEPYPTIVTEYSSNGSLDRIINQERQSLSLPQWDDTQKLINIYGIASAMSYLHANNIIHRDLKPANILEDDYLFPKIADFGLSKVSHSKASMTTQSMAGFKGTPIYVPPESWETGEYTKAGDVYAFSIIVYEIMTVEEPFKDFTIPMIFSKVVSKGYRPEIDSTIADCYRNLISRCWSQNPEERPTFDNIVDELKSNEDFITDLIDKDKYYEYIDLIDTLGSSFNPSKKFPKITLSEIPEKVIENESYETASKDDKNKTAAKDDQNPTKKEQNTTEDDDENGTKDDEDKNSTNSDDDDDIDNKKKSDKKSSKSKKHSHHKQKIYKELSKLDEFGKLSDEVQFIIKKELSEQGESGKKTILFHSDKTVMLYANDSLKSPVFVNVLKFFDDITFEVKHPSDFFETILLTVISLKGVVNKGMMCRIVSSDISKLGEILINKNMNFSVFINSMNLKAVCNEFEKCKNLVQLTIPSSVKSIDDYAFNECSSLREVNLPSSVILIGRASFKDCSSLAEIKLPSSLISIDDNSFGGCSSLVEVSIPSSVISIGASSFSFCTKLEEFSIPSSSGLNSIENCTFQFCSSLKRFVVPSSVKVIGEKAFNKCSSLSEIVIPSSVNSIGDNAFYKCSSLKEIKMPPFLLSIGKFAFFNCSSLCEVVVPSSVASIGESAFSFCTSVKVVSISSPVVVIDKNAFKDCYSLNEISIPDSVDSLKDLVDSASLTVNNLPAPVTKIGKKMFDNCAPMMQMALPSSFKKIPVEDYLGFDKSVRITKK